MKFEDRTGDLGSALAGGPAFLLLGESESGETDQMYAYGWNGVYTSRVDSGISGQFENNNRTVQRFGPSLQIPTRSAQQLQIRHLLGGLLLPDDELPGSDAVSRVYRKAAGLREISRLAEETITPRGVLVIEHWSPSDSLRSEDLIPILATNLGVGQVHIFSSDNWRGNELIADLVDRGIGILHSRSLNSAIADLSNAGALTSRSEGGVSGHIIPVNDKFVPIDVAVWNDVRRSARPIDLDLLRPSSHASSASLYQEFRSFMGAPEGAPLWSGIASGMNLRRDFEGPLEVAVREAIEADDTFEPVIVAGQTSTGKSVALAALAVRLASTGDATVLHQSRRTARPSLDDIELFAQWAEENGSRATVFIWDGMLDGGEYESMARRLQARGRRVVVVGSSYISDVTTNATLVKAPSRLSPSELDSLTGMLRSYGVEIAPRPGPVDSSFLGFLYRALPETEYVLRHGLAAEMRAAERGVVKLAVDVQDDLDVQSRMTAIQAAFNAAGYKLPSNLATESVADNLVYEATFEQRSAVQKVTSLVVVAGRHGLPVPIDLALRVLGADGAQSVRSALRAHDIIRDIEDGSGEWSLVTRSRLEAMLLARHEIALDVESEIIRSIIENARVTMGFAGADELNFVVSLLERVGANGDDLRFRPHYLRFADALRRRRQNDGVFVPRLVLQESALTRAHVHWQQKENTSTANERIELLEHNQDMLQAALSEDVVRGPIRMSLAVELASTIGAIAHEATHSSEHVQNSLDVISRLDDVFGAVKSALEVDPANTHPIDVLAWATRDALESGILSEMERLDRSATVLAMLGAVDRNSLSEAKRAQLDQRGAMIEKLMKNDDKMWEYLAALDSNSDPAATFLLAQFDSRDGDRGEKRAYERLINSAASYSDWRCADLLLKLAWKNSTGYELLRGERRPLIAGGADSLEMWKMLSRLSNVDFPDPYKIDYARGMCEFLRGDYSSSRISLRRVQDATRQLARRLHTTNLIADVDGKARVYSGRVNWAQGRGGELWVNELGVGIRFDPTRFSASGEMAKGQIVSRFVVGFKLSTGAVAEPVGFGQGGR